MKKILLFLFLLLIANISKAQHEVEGTKPFVLGVIDSIYSTELSETRTLNIYLPEGYSFDSVRTYPVIYLLDGSADEDFIHVAGIVQYNNFSWINRFPKTILVGIANTGNRKKDFTFPVKNLDFLVKVGFEKKVFPQYGGSANFISFIEKELQPFIEEKYHTNSSKTIIGQSLGGLLASEILIKKPSLFDTYIIISPSLWWGNESLLASHFSKSGLAKTSVYISVGNEGKIMIDDAKNLAALLKRNGASEIIYNFLPDENHATIGHQAVYDAFKLLYPLK